ncbi:MAG TPA: HNH endonuclease, partial [Phycicoccus sp.]|nr:HNH endonuclease [Phycicoccus sp.]
RLFPAHLVKRLWLRDRGCTFPGCTMPAKWTQAHHLTWHRHAGPTTLANGALLCSHHHHVVHARHLLGRLDPTTNTITWDLTPGSYTHPPDP